MSQPLVQTVTNYLEETGTTEAVERVEKAVESLAKNADDAEIKSEAEKLLAEIRKYKQDIS